MDLTEESLEEALQGITALCDKTGRAIAIKPTTLHIRPEILSQLAILHGVTQAEMLRRVQQIAIDAYNKYDFKA